MRTRGPAAPVAHRSPVRRAFAWTARRRAYTMLFLVSFVLLHAVGL